MWKAGLLATAFVGASASGALAVDLVVKSSLIQSIAIDSNYQMQPNPPGEPGPAGKHFAARSCSSDADYAF